MNCNDSNYDGGPRFSAIHHRPNFPGHHTPAAPVLPRPLSRCPRGRGHSFFMGSADGFAACRRQHSYAGSCNLAPAFRSGVWSSSRHPGAYLLKFKLFQPRRVVHISPAEIAPAGQIPALQAPRAPPQAPRPPGEYLQQSHPRQDSPSRHHHQARQAHPAAPAAPG